MMSPRAKRPKTCSMKTPECLEPDWIQAFLLISFNVFCFRMSCKLICLMRSRCRWTLGKWTIIIIRPRKWSSQNKASISTKIATSTPRNSSGYHNLSSVKILSHSKATRIYPKLITCFGFSTWTLQSAWICFDLTSIWARITTLTRVQLAVSRTSTKAPLRCSTMNSSGFWKMLWEIAAMLARCRSEAIIITENRS